MLPTVPPLEKSADGKAQGFVDNLKRSKPIAQAVAPSKGIAFGEAGSALTFAGLALLSIIIAAKAYKHEYAFHAYLFAGASVASVFAIMNRYYDRPAQLHHGIGRSRDFGDTAQMALRRETSRV